MQDLSIANDGISYIFKCISLYNGSAFFLLIYAAIVVVIAFKGTEEMKRIFLYPSIVMLFTVYNPLLPVVINRVFDINKEYYRFMWITPVAVLIAATASYWLISAKHGRGFIVPAFLGITCLIIAAGTFVYEDGYRVAENPYKIPNEVIAVSNMIRKNTDMKYPVAVCDRDMQMELRQYDATILLAADRTQYLNFLGDGYEDELMQEKNEYVNRLLTVVGKFEKIDKDSFTEALNKTNTQFVVVPKTAPVLRFLSDAGLEAVGTTGTRVVYRFELDDPIYYDLADYNALS